MTTPTNGSEFKLILIIVRDEDRKPIVNCLLEANFRVTEFASTGGFLRRGKTTLLVGVAAPRVDEALALVRAQCPTASDADEHTATIFVLPIHHFTEI